MPDNRNHLRAVLAVRTAELNRRPDDAALQSARADAARDYYAQALAEHVAAVVAKAPPLTDEQRRRITALLVAS